MSMREKIIGAISDNQRLAAMGVQMSLNEVNALIDDVLDALLEPTDGMTTEGGKNGEWSGRVRGSESEEAKSVFQAMIRAVKEGK